MVDRIRLGEHGFALVVAPNGALIAHGDPDKKALVARARNMQDHPLVQLLRSASGDTPVADEYEDGGRSQLGVATRIAALGWTVIVEQPTAEAYASATAAPAAAGRGHLRRAARHDRGRLFLRPAVPDADSRAAARHPGDCRRRSHHPRGHPDRRRVRRSRRRVQPDGGSAGRAAGERQAPGAPGDVRPPRRRSRSRSLAPDSEPGQQHAPAGARRYRRGIAPGHPRHHRTRARDAQAVHGRPSPRRQAETGRTIRAGRQRLGRRDRRSDARGRGAGRASRWTPATRTSR